MKNLVFIMLIFIACQNFAYTEPGISFSDAAKLAVESSWELRNEQAANALREGAWTWGIRAWLPHISISASEDDRLSETAADSFIKNYSLNVEQLIWDGGRLSRTRKMERAELDFAEGRLRQMVSDIAEIAVSSYRDVLHGRMILEIQNSALESLNQQIRVLQREVELGLVRPTELIQAELTTAMHELEIISLSMDLEDAERRLAEMLGLEELPLLLERIDTERSPELPHPAAVLPVVESRNPDLAALRLSVARLQTEARSASLSWLPTLRLTGSFGLSGRQYPLSRYNWSVGLSIDFSSGWLSGGFGASTGGDPPFDRNARMHQSIRPVPDPAASFSPRAANLALAHEQNRYEAALKEIQAMVERLINTCRILDRRRILAMEALVLERDRYRLTELRLSLGEITRIDLMEGMLELARREAGLVEAAAMVYRAERELERFLDLEPGGLSMLTEEFK